MDGPQGLSPMLSRLAAECATGVLMRERGTLYLSEGLVVHAESPATPGIDVLLTARGALNADGWREAVAEAGTRNRVGRFLVDSGKISEGALELCHLGTLYDAAFFVLGPSSAPARFRYGAAHWLGSVHPVPVAAVERETLRRRELLHRIWPDPETDDAPLVRADRPAEPTVTPRQGAVLNLVDGVRTSADISGVLGRPAFHTLVDLRRLAAAGIITALPRAVATARHREEFDAAIPAEARAALRAAHPTESPPAVLAATTTTDPPNAPVATESYASVTTEPYPPVATEPYAPVTIEPEPYPSGAESPAAAPTITPTGETPGPAPNHTPNFPPNPTPLAAHASADPHVTLLRRLRDALEAL